jgi:hypothetical protein
VASVALMPQPTGGVELDDAPGDDGVTVALDLRDERGERVQKAGAISVVVLDLSQNGPAARVARWDLDREQVEQLADREDTRAAMVLHMAWPANPPKREQLQMHVRYVTEDGRKLEAYRDIRVKLPSGSAGRSGATKASSNRRSPIVPATATGDVPATANGGTAGGGWRSRTPSMGAAGGKNAEPVVR